MYALLAVAETHGVRAELQQQWSRKDLDLAEKASGSVKGATAKAWRYVGEMEEIATTFKEAGMPGDFHKAAAVIYRRISHLKNTSTEPSLEDVMAALVQSEAKKPVAKSH